MSLRLKCPSCQAAFLTSNDALGQSAACPKCGAEQQVPRSILAGDPDSPESSVWVPRPEDQPKRDRRRLKWVGLAVLFSLPILVVGALVVWPWLRDRAEQGQDAPPLHPAEVAARNYLQALVEQDQETAQQLGTVADPPAIRTFEAPRMDQTRTQSVRGSFAPIAALNARIENEYVYNDQLARFEPRNTLGTAAETLDALHETKEMAETSNVFSRLADPDPHAALDAIDDLARVFQPMTNLSETVLSPERLLPTYTQLVEQADPSLPPVERSLALDFGANQATWDALLNRPFSTIQADGPFLLDRAEIVAHVVDQLSEGDSAPIPLRLTLTRFRLEGIDTGWRVTDTRRESPEAWPTYEQAPTTEDPPPTPEPRYLSPGELFPMDTSGDWES